MIHPYNRKTDTLIFLHIGKTAGTSLRKIIHQEYRYDNVFTLGAGQHSLRTFPNLPQQQRQNLHVVIGHMQYGLHQHLPRRAVYITCLRDPIERLISLFYYIKQEREHGLNPIINAKNLDLRGFIQAALDREIDTHLADNYQTKSIAGSAPYYGTYGSELFDTAQQNLKDNFAVIGLSERFDETVLLMQHILGWDTPFYRTQNITRSRAKRSDLDSATLSLIEQTSILDLTLYEYGKTWLETAIAQYSEAFQQKLARFKQQNGSAWSHFLYNTRRQPPYFMFRAMRKLRRMTGFMPVDDL